MREIHWAVLGTGVIANEMATALEKNGKKLYAVGNRTYEKAVKFGEKYGIKKVYTDFNEMLHRSGGGCDLYYNAFIIPISSL